MLREDFNGGEQHQVATAVGLAPTSDSGTEPVHSNRDLRRKTCCAVPSDSLVSFTTCVRSSTVSVTSQNAERTMLVIVIVNIVVIVLQLSKEPYESHS